MTTVAATEFKSKCLALLEQVRTTRVPLAVTKRGKEIARVVPVPDEAAAPDLRGSIVFQAEDLTSTGENWEADQA